MAGNPPVCTYGGVTEPVNTSAAQWTITGWGQTVLYGAIEYDSAADVTRLRNHTSSDNLPIYRPFVAGSFTPANAQEAFTHDMHTEVVAYDFQGKIPELAAGATLTPEILAAKKVGYAAVAAPVAAAATSPAGLYRIYLDSVSLPNSIEVGWQGTIGGIFGSESSLYSGQTKLLGCFPLTPNIPNDPRYYTNAGDCATQGVFAGGTIVNEPMVVTVLPEPSRVANDEYWYMELEVQLLCNEAEQADSVY